MKSDSKRAQVRGERTQKWEFSPLQQNTQNSESEGKGRGSASTGKIIIQQFFELNRAK
jgi:hypothetical protein